jgi:hypothetical protein
VAIAVETSALPTLAEVKAHLNVPVDDTSSDAKLTGYLDSAVEAVEARIGPLALRTLPPEVHQANGSTIILRHPPAREVLSVATTSWGTVLSTVALIDVRLEGEAGLLRLRAPLYGEVTVTYTAGRDAVPAVVREVLLDLVRVRFESRAGALPVPVAEEPDLPRPFPPSDDAILARLDHLSVNSHAVA